MSTNATKNTEAKQQQSQAKSPNTNPITTSIPKVNAPVWGVQTKAKSLAEIQEEELRQKQQELLQQQQRERELAAAQKNQKKQVIYLFSTHNL